MLFGRGTESQLLQLVTALSLAGYMIREPIQNESHLINQGALQDFWSTYDPYQTANSGVMGPLAPSLLPDGHNYLHHHKGYTAENGHESLEELRRLVSWQEAHRRGDMTMPDNQHVLPATSFSSYNTLPHNGESFSEDAGYASGGSVRSPGSVEGSLSSVFGGSPLPDDLHQFLFDENSNGAESSISNEKELDLDEILGFNDESNGEHIESHHDLNSYLNENPLKNILHTLQNLPDDLEQIHSPFKDPSFDDFLPTNQGATQNGILQSPTNDPFQMQYDDTSLLLNKHLPDNFLEAIETGSDSSLPSISGNMDLDYDFDPNDLERMIFDGVCNSPLKKISQDDGFFDSPIKHHSESPSTPTHITDHTYSKKFKEEVFDDFQNSPRKPATHQYGGSPDTKPKVTEQGTPQVPIQRSGRTFAPSSRVGLATDVVQHEPKKEEGASGSNDAPISQSKLLWPDFYYTEDDIINMPVERFNEVIKGLSDMKQHIARDVRRKGKNKLAARNCRKRKVDVIQTLDDGVDELVKQKEQLLSERQQLMEETQNIKRKTDLLNGRIFEHLQNIDSSVSHRDYSLEYTSDGNVYLVPSGVRHREVRKNAKLVT